MTDTALADKLQEAANPERRDPNLWAKCFVEAEGNEGKAQALYVKAKTAAAKPIPEAPTSGWCPNCCNECQLDASNCQKCGAVFESGGWMPTPYKPSSRPSAEPQPTHQVFKTAKSRGVYIILGLFLGCFGIHNFYAGRYTAGAIQIIITLLLGWLVVGFVVTGIWALIELFTVKTDGAGDPMA